MNLKSRLVADWQWVLKHAWSVRLIALAAVLSGLEVLLPLISNFFPRGIFAILTVITTAAAFVLRLVAQSRSND